MSASNVHLPVWESTLAMPEGLVGLPCEQPPPATSAYSVPSRNATSATPMRSPIASWVDGNPLATVEIVELWTLIREIRAELPPLYGPTTGPGTWGHCPTVLLLPPRPASATYRPPSGPNLRPRGASRCCATTVNAGSCARPGTGASPALAAPTASSDDNGFERFIVFSPICWMSGSLPVSAPQRP